MQLKSENNNRDHQAAPPPPPAKNQRPTYLPVPVIPVTVQCDYDSDESDGPILYRDDEDENMSEEGKIILTNRISKIFEIQNLNFSI